MNTGPAAWEDVDPPSQWVAELLGGGPEGKPEPGMDGPCGGPLLLDGPTMREQREPGD